MKKFATILLAALWALPGSAQSYMLRAERFSADSLGPGRNPSLSIDWIGNGNRYAFYDIDVQDKPVYYLIDLKTGKQRRMFDNARMVRLLTPYADSLRRPTQKRPGISRPEFDGHAPLQFTFNYNNHRLQYDIRSQRLQELAKVQKPQTIASWDMDYSADSLYCITAVRHDLVLIGRDGDTVRMTSDGEPGYSFADDDTDGKGTSGVSGRWIGKTHKYVAIREDLRKVETLTLINSLTERPSAKTYKYVAAGDKEVVRYAIYLIDADRKVVVPLGIDRFPDQKIELGTLHTFVSTDRAAYFLRRSRTCDSMELCRIDAADNSVRPIIRETTPKHLNEQLFSYHVIDGGKEILWWSERSGRGQFYLYDGEGKLKNTVTDGRFVAGNILRIDTLRRFLIVEGYGGEPGINPHYRLYYKVPLDSGQSVCLTPENGHHSADAAPCGNYLLDKWSRMDLPEKRRIADMRGRTVCELPGCDISEIRAKGWAAPKLQELLAADSVTKLYGIIYFPSVIEPGHKYPIISHVYPGPQDDQVPLAFSVSNADMTLAQLGFVVINFSHRGGCPTRGRDYYNYGYGNLRDFALADDMALIRQVAALYPLADIERVGIYGHSGGGFMTAAALLQHPEFYKAGVAASGNHDNNIYGQAWGEVYHGVTQHVDKNGRISFECKVPTTIELAGNLRGRLLLVHGDMDDNVHPASTMRLADALIKAGKRFDMMIIPGADHGLPVNYFTNLVRYYFVENLLGLPQNDTNIIKHK